MQDISVKHRMTVDQFLSWEGEPGCRYELIDGEPVMMAPNTWRHGILQGNLYALLQSAMRGSGYQVSLGTGVRRFSQDERLYAPDITVR